MTCNDCYHCGLADDIAQAIGKNLVQNPLQSRFLQCVLTAAIAVAPQFISQLVTCLQQGGGSSGYNPGDRDRCN